MKLMKQKARKMRKRAVTLIEMMIVMFLIALITGVVAYNYQSALERGKVFKTKQGIERIQTVLALYLAEYPDARDDLSQNWKRYLKESPLVKDADDLSRDGWGNPYTEVDIVVDRETGEEKIIVISRRYEQYKQTSEK